MNIENKQTEENKTEQDKTPTTNKGEKDTTPKTGTIVGIRITGEEEDVMLITDKGTIIRLAVKEVSVLGRSTQGVTLMRTNDGAKVVSIETIPTEENIEE